MRILDKIKKVVVGEQSNHRETRNSSFVQNEVVKDEDVRVNKQAQTWVDRLREENPGISIKLIKTETGQERIELNCIPEMLYMPDDIKYDINNPAVMQAMQNGVVQQYPIVMKPLRGEIKSNLEMLYELKRLNINPDKPSDSVPIKVLDMLFKDEMMYMTPDTLVGKGVGSWSYRIQSESGKLVLPKNMDIKNLNLPRGVSISFDGEKSSLVGPESMQGRVKTMEVLNEGVGVLKDAVIADTFDSIEKLRQEYRAKKDAEFLIGKEKIYEEHKRHLDDLRKSEIERLKQDRDKYQKLLNEHKIDIKDNSLAKILTELQAQIDKCENSKNKFDRADKILNIASVNKSNDCTYVGNIDTALDLVTALKKLNPEAHIKSITVGKTEKIELDCLPEMLNMPEGFSYDAKYGISNGIDKKSISAGIELQPLEGGFESALDVFYELRRLNPNVDIKLEDLNKENVKLYPYQFLDSENIFLPKGIVLKDLKCGEALSNRAESHLKYNYGDQQKSLNVCTSKDKEQDSMLNRKNVVDNKIKRKWEIVDSGIAMDTEDTSNDIWESGRTNL